MGYKVYVLVSLRAGKTYVGYTNNLVKRLEQHNSGKSGFTKTFAPWKVIYTEDFENQVDAVKREKYLKSSSGRKKILKPLFS